MNKQTKVRDMETGEVGKIEERLSNQFTANMNGKVRFYFYRDRNITWEVSA